MPIDSSIALQLRAPQPINPAELYSNALALKTGMQRNALLDLQTQQTQQALDDERGQRAIVMDPSLKFEDVPNKLLRAGYVKPALEIQTKVLANRNTQSQIDERQVQILDRAHKIIGGVFADVAANPQATREDFLAATGMLRGIGVPDTFLGPIEQRIPANSMAIPAFARQIAISSENGRQALQSLLPKVEMKTIRGPGGGPVTAPMNVNPMGGPLGVIEGAPQAAEPVKYETRNRGAFQESIDPYTGKPVPGTQAPNSMSPSEAANVGLRAQEVGLHRANTFFNTGMTGMNAGGGGGAVPIPQVGAPIPQRAAPPAAAMPPQAGPQSPVYGPRSAVPLPAPAMPLQGPIPQQAPQALQGTLTPKAAAEREAARPQATLALQDALVNMDRLANEAKALMLHPGLGGITAIEGKFPDMPGSNAADARAKLETLKAQAGFAVLQAMRDASKTGGALGNVTEREGVWLQNALAAVATSQSTKALRENLQQIIDYTGGAKGRLSDAYGMTYGQQSIPGAQSGSRPPLSSFQR